MRDRIVYQLTASQDLAFENFVAWATINWPKYRDDENREENFNEVFSEALSSRFSLFQILPIFILS